MNFKVAVPDSVWGGWYWKSRKGYFALSLLGHTLQCDQRWVFMVRIGSRRIGYRTHGDAAPNMLTYHDAGWYWPWQDRWGSGRV